MTSQDQPAIAWFPQYSALVLKELSRIYRMRSLWIIQALILLIFGSLFFIVLFQDAGSTRNVFAFFAYAYFAGLWFAPAITVGALVDERESGMLEILSAVPMDKFRMVSAILIARALFLLQLVFYLLPPLFIVSVVGSGDIVQPFFRAMLAILIGGSLTTLQGLVLVA